MKRFKIIKEYPAYDVVTFAEGVEHKVYDGEVLTDSKHLENWKLSSVVGYAVECGNNPIEKYNDAISKGHETHYAMNLGATLTDYQQEKGQRIEVNYGDIIIFHDIKFKIEKAPNHNINLIKI